VGDRIDATVANMRFVKPIDRDLILQLAASHELLVTLEENAIIGGAGSEVTRVLHEAGVPVRVLQLGLPDRFIDHGDHAQLFTEIGLDVPGILKRIEQAYQPNS
jgi:1-deoxy-D-xylulose-5-phosphate synthase